MKHLGIGWSCRSHMYHATGGLERPTLLVGGLAVSVCGWLSAVYRTGCAAVCSRKTHCLLLWCLQVNYDALLDLMCLVVDQQLAQGPKAFLGDWSEATPYLNKLKGSQAAHGGAVLVFLPGAPEISRAQRALLGSERLAAAAGGRQNLRVLPLHGSLSSEDQKRVFSR